MRILMNKKFLFFLLLMSISKLTFADNVKKASKLMDKQEYDKAEELLKEEIAVDSLSPSANFVYSQLLLVSEFEKQNVDSAHVKILLAQKGYHNIDDERILDKLAKAEITRDRLDQQEALIDSLAYEHTKSVNTIDRYQYFIDAYPDARQKDDAIAQRNSMAYDQASQKGTFLAYYEFMEQYPKAKQYPKARKQYDALLFKAKTKNGKLKSYMNFLKEYPNTPFRAQAEEQIFNFVASDNSETPLLWFLQEYSQTSKVAPTAMGYLYYWYKEHDQLPAFFERFGSVSKIDSLKNFAQLSQADWNPFFDQKQFVFINHEGKQTMPNRFDEVARDYKCNAVSGDVLLVVEQGKSKLIARDGHLVYDGKVNEAYDLGYGVMEIINGNARGLVHKTGKILATPQYDEIRRLSPSFFAVRKRQVWGVISATGRVALKPEFDEVEHEGNFYILRKGKKYAFTDKRFLVQGADNSSVPLFFNFDDYEVVDDGHIIGIVGNQEVLYDQSMKEIIPLALQSINPANSHWISKTTDYVLFDSLGNLKYEEAFNSFNFNDEWWSAQKNGWSLQRWDDPSSPTFEYDSVAFLGRDFIYTRNDSTSILFKNGKYLNLKQGEKCKVLTTGDIDQPVEYLALIAGKQYKSVLDSTGQEVLKGNYSSIVPLDSSMFVVEVNKRKGIVKKGNQQMLKTLYNGIADYQQGYVSLLLNGKFGIFNPYNSLYVRPQYATKLVPVNDQLLFADKAGKWGAVDGKGKEKIPFKYEMLENYADSLVLAKMDKKWQVLNVRTQTPLMEGIDRYLPVNPKQKGGDLIIVVNGKEGLFNQKKGTVIKPTFDRMSNIGTPEAPLFVGEKYISEADLYIWVYYDQAGNRLRQQTFNAQDFERIDCIE